MCRRDTLRKLIRIFRSCVGPPFSGLNGHAGQSDLLRWLEEFAASGPHVFLTDGVEPGRKPLGKLIKKRFKLRVDYPQLNETIEI